MQDQYDQFIGKKYSTVNEQIFTQAALQGLEVLPWPINIELVSEDPDTLIVYINNDIDEIIVAIKIVSG